MWTLAQYAAKIQNIQDGRHKHPLKFNISTVSMCDFYWLYLKLGDANL